MTPYLSIEALSVSYGSTRVLDRVSLAVDKGELVALLGSSGCGKTTLLRSIAGFVAAQEGRIRVDGRDITRLPPEIARHRDDVPVLCAVAAHERRRQHRLRAAHARLGEGPDRGARRRDAQAPAARRLRQPHDRRSFPAGSSSGSRSAVRWRSTRSVLLLDEPMSNLDYKVRLELRHELRALQQRVGITAVYVTHDREEALTLADRIAVIDAGRIAQTARPRRCSTGRRSPFVAGFHGRRQRARRRALDDGAWRRAGETRDRRAARAPISAASARACSSRRRGAPSRRAGDGRHGRAAPLPRQRRSATACARAATKSGSRTIRPRDEGAQVRVAVAPDALLLFSAAAR